MRRWISLTGAVVILVSIMLQVIPVPVHAGSAAGYWENIYWDIDGVTGVMTVSGEGAIPSVDRGMMSYGYDCIPWFSYRESVTTLYIEEGITKIPAFVFDCFSNLTEIYLPSTLAEFRGLSLNATDQIKSIQVHPDSPYFSSVDGVLYNKDQSCIVRYPTGRQGVFVIPSTVKTIGISSFESCKGLTEVIIPNGVTLVEEKAFFVCKGIQKMIIPDSVVTIKSFSFAGCTSMKELKISDNIEIIADYAFFGNDGLTHVVLPKKLIRIKDNAFRECVNLKSITMFEKVKTIEALAFDKCDNFNEAYYLGTQEQLEEINSNWLFYKKTVHYGLSGNLDNGIRWELKADEKTMRLAGSGSLSGSESIWTDYGTYFSKVYVQKGITGTEKCLTAEYSHCGNEQKDGVEYEVYATVKSVTYDANGGTGAPELQYQTHGEALKLSQQKPKKDGYVFLGWSEDKKAKTAEYPAGGSVTLRESITLYAVWEPVKAVSLKIETLPKKALYAIGEALALDGLKVVLVYNDGNKKDVTAACTVVGYDPKTAGNQTVTVSCEGMKTSFEVCVLPEEAKLTAIRVVLSKREYEVGEELDAAGITMELTYDNGMTQTISQGFTVDGFSTETAGTVTLTFHYQQMETSTTITVVELPRETQTEQETSDPNPTEIPKETEGKTEEETKDPPLEPKGEPATSWYVPVIGAAAFLLAVVLILVRRRKK